MPISTHASDQVRSLLRDVDPEGELAPCGLQRLVLGSGAIGTVADTVTELLDARRGAGRAPSRPVVAVLVDRTPILRRGEDVKALVQHQLAARFDVRTTVLDDGHSELHVVDEVLAEAATAVRGADAVVAVGAGTISDIGKVAARAGDGTHAPVLVSVQTAASVDGYTDDVSVVLRDGVKRTVPSRWPDAVVADTETIAEAPAAMNRAGYGEMTSMLVAPADWRLASLVGTDPGYREPAIRLLDAVGADLEDWSPGVRRAEPAAVAGLTRALALRGVATGVAGTTAVLSGVEHLVSHMLDQHHTVHHLPMGLHGAQVGVAAVVAASAWEMLFERLDASGPVVDERRLDPAVARADVQQAFAHLDPGGRVAAECWRDYERKLGAIADNRARLDALLRGWDDHAADLRRLVRPSAVIAGGLRTAGAAATFAELNPAVTPETARWAVASCAFMRNRFTVVDLLTLLGCWTDDDVDEVLHRAAAAVGAASGQVA